HRARALVLPQRRALLRAQTGGGSVKRSRAWLYCPMQSTASFAEEMEGTRRRDAEWAEIKRTWGVLPGVFLEWMADVALPWIVEWDRTHLFGRPDDFKDDLHASELWPVMRRYMSDYPVEWRQFVEAKR